MTPESRYADLLERRIELLRSLAENLVQSRGAFVAMDFDAIERLIAEQQQACARIRSLDVEIGAAQTRCAEKIGVQPPSAVIAWPALATEAPGSDRIRTAMRSLAEAQAQLKAVNEGHRAMLRRSRRAMQILRNFYSSFAPIYSAPAPAATSFEERA